jgi:hypothetical protein
MASFIVETLIHAAPDICFDLMRDIRIHTVTTSQTNERAVDGIKDALIGMGQTVTFEGTLSVFGSGLRYRLLNLIGPGFSSMR